MSISAMKQALKALERGRSQIIGVLVQQDQDEAISALRQAIEQAEKQEPVAWATREDFYRELDRRVNLMQQQMEIKTVLMRCKNYDLALPIINIYEGHVLVGQVTQPKREWVGLTDEERWEVVGRKWWDWEDAFDIEGFARAIEAKLREKNHG